MVAEGTVGTGTAMTYQLKLLGHYPERAPCPITPAMAHIGEACCSCDWGTLG